MEVYKIMEVRNDNKKVLVELSSNEAIVLLDWLTKFNEKEHPWLFEDQAEERILFDLESSLEKIVSQTFEEIRDKE
jgi:hypothetical protein